MTYFELWLYRQLVILWFMVVILWLEVKIRYVDAKLKIFDFILNHIPETKNEAN